MRRETPLPGGPLRPPVGTTGPPPAPLEVIYVVQTTAGVICKRQHRLCRPLYVKRHQAQIELMHIQNAAGSCDGTYSVWKATTHVEPAEWLYDVVVADGSLVRLGGGIQ